METSNRKLRIFYQQLSKLFYAMAAIDGTIREEEVNELKNIVKKEWHSVEDKLDEYGTDFVYYILITFDWLSANDWNIKKVISDFKIYKRNHQQLFTPPINKLILKTCYAIASAFALRNKSEMVLYSQIVAVLSDQPSEMK
ncbi:hypothetical protein QG516_25315 [Pedobacter gandavensis]|uniref:hypothetical protein n=1 Tax=Pedobacter gandavensis TaxID=2679963 RepID=UPI0024784DCC|nr:hypothetical protein [Pedobacter gandavensis]WGQ09836.1 hypothetical protein QG516_25315 [Pedobacter gandavensis]